ncbi:MAG: aromatic-ring-opening dioxygenase LigAB, LigA subunit [Herminiimonas sp.]|jgi:hypothetical protein|nr:aromatic-ring-opening dioxygenase LigAB, LigA subunit [Herminiimonas sp.]
MSLYQVQKVLFQINNQPDMSERFQCDVEGFLDAYDLTGHERKALIEADVGTLYAMNVHPLLLAPFGGRAGLAWPQYIQALKNGVQRHEGQSA